MIRGAPAPCSTLGMPAAAPAMRAGDLTAGRQRCHDPRAAREGRDHRRDLRRESRLRQPVRQFPRRPRPGRGRRRQRAAAARLSRRSCDRDGTVLAVLPPTWGGVTASGYSRWSPSEERGAAECAVLDRARLHAAIRTSPVDVRGVTRDLYHRFFEHQMQIDGGKQRRLCRLVRCRRPRDGPLRLQPVRRCMRSPESSCSPIKFFQGAFGGSFLNHQYLICACAPEYPNADTAAAKPSIAVLDTGCRRALSAAPRSCAADSPASALDGPPQIRRKRQHRAAPTISATASSTRSTPCSRRISRAAIRRPPATHAFLCRSRQADHVAAADRSRPSAIGWMRKQLRWAWYAGAWNAALADGRQPPIEAAPAIYAPETPGGQPGLSTAPSAVQLLRGVRSQAAAGAAPAASEGLRRDLIADAAAGRLPPVVFYKPQGNLNQHPGYASVAEGDAHIADLVAKLRASPQWNAHGDRDHLRRVRRRMGSRAAAARRSAGAGRAHTGAHHLALREERQRRSHAVRHRVDSAADHAAFRLAAAAGHRRRATRRSPPTARRRWAISPTRSICGR